MSLAVPVVPLDALLSSDRPEPLKPWADPHETLARAEVILGQDVLTRQQFIVYGREAMEEMAAGEHGASRHVAILAVELDMESEELDQLLALVESLKGYHDYKKVEESPDR